MKKLLILITVICMSYCTPEKEIQYENQILRYYKTDINLRWDGSAWKECYHYYWITQNRDIINEYSFVKMIYPAGYIRQVLMKR